MSHLQRFAPPTQLDVLRTLLSGFSNGDKTFLPQFQKCLHSLRQMALPELGRRLGRTTTPQGLRRAILEATATFDWPDWDQHLMHMLQPEEDLELFDLGCAALGGLCNQRALQGLKRLKAQRKNRERQAILDREISRYYASQSFEGCLADLMKGEDDPATARSGACGLAVLLDGLNLNQLLQVFRKGDTLTRRLALYLLAFLQEPISEGLLLSLFQEVHEEITGTRHATSLAAPLQTLSRESLRETLDDLASLLAARVETGRANFEDTMPVLELAFQARTGGEGLLIAYLRLIPTDDRERLERILEEPDVQRLMRCIEVLGAREEDQLVPVFLQGMKDPRLAVSQLAIRQFAKLPSGAPAMLELFASEKMDQMREAIRFFRENRTQAALSPLMRFLSSDVSDDLLVDAVNALGAIGDPAATNVLLSLLHDGKPLVLQLALADALGRLGTPGASLGLLKKTEQIKLPQVLLLSLKGALAAFPGFDHPFPQGQLQALEGLVERCCDVREGGGQWQGAALALNDLFVFDAEVYRRLRGRLSEFVATKSPKSLAERESRERMAEVLRVLTQRADSLSILGKREQILQKQIEAYPPRGKDRIPALLEMREILAVPGVILSVEFGQELVAFLRKELIREEPTPEESLLLCELAGLSGRVMLKETLRDVFAYASDATLQGAARKALLALGVAEHEIERRAPIHTMLLLEPNAFFRKRMVTVLEGAGRRLTAVATRQEAEALLADDPVDLLITESQDECGELGPWVESEWGQRRIRYVLMSTASHYLGSLKGKPWVIGQLYKPYPLDELVKALDV